MVELVILLHIVLTKFNAKWTPMSFYMSYFKSTYTKGFKKNSEYQRLKVRVIFLEMLVVSSFKLENKSVFPRYLSKKFNKFLSSTLMWGR